MTIDQYTIGAPDWVLPTAILGAVLLLIVVWAYISAPASRGTRLAALALKVVALAAIAVCLLEPLATGRRPRPKSNVIALVVDNSQSMRVGGLADANRRERLKQRMSREAKWRARLEQDFDVRTYAFDSRLFAADDYGSLEFDGYASSLVRSLDTIGSRYASRPVAGLLLFTDGNATDLAAERPRWEDLGFPAYPVVDSERSEIRDLAIGAVSVNQSDFEAAPVTLQVEVQSTGFAGQKIVAQLLDEEDKLVEEQILPLPAGGGPANVRFRFRPEQSGVCFYRVVVFLEAQRAAFAAEKSGPEATLANNVRLIAVQGRRGPYRVLYVAGRPNWEFKFLRRALEEDDEIKLDGLIRIARKEPKFVFGDRDVGDANPLFRGFSEDEEETSEHDEPVLLRFADGTDLKGGFPKVAEDLFAYHAVVIDDLEADYFTQDQMLLLRRFVAARGGGVLLLGGPDAFAKGGYDRTPLGELSPVYVSPNPEDEVQGDAFRMQLTREGWLEPWIRLRDTEEAERARLRTMPEFKTLSQVGRVKAGASVLATVASADDAERPLFVVQRFGKGRSAALLAGDMWRWALHRKENQNEDLPQAWRQTIRWLVADAPRRVELKVQQADDPAEPVSLHVHVYDGEFLPQDNALVELKVASPQGNDFTLTAEPAVSTAGLYETSYWPREDGGYRVQAVVRGPDGSKLPMARGGWTAEPAAAEYRHLQTNNELLEDLAEKTGGEVVSLDDLERFVATLPNRQVPVTETWVYPVWHQPWVLAVAVLCLCAEWGLRRWRGLP